MMMSKGCRVSVKRNGHPAEGVIYATDKNGAYITFNDRNNGYYVWTEVTLISYGVRYSRTGY